jgi:hypothetical protein
MHAHSSLAMNGRHIVKRSGSLPGLERAATPARHFIGRRLALRSRASHREQKWISMSCVQSSTTSSIIFDLGQRAGSDCGPDLAADYQTRTSFSYQILIVHADAGVSFDVLRDARHRDTALRVPDHFRGRPKDCRINVGPEPRCRRQPITTSRFRMPICGAAIPMPCAAETNSGTYQRSLFVLNVA